MEVKSHIVGHDNKRSRKRTLCQYDPGYKKSSAKYLGIALTLSFIIALELLHKVDLWISNLTGFFAIAVVYTVFKCGMRMGMVSSLIGIIYVFYYMFFNMPDHKSEIFLMSFLTLHSILLLGLTLMVGRLNEKILTMNRELIIERECLARTEENSIIMVAYSDLKGGITRVPDKFCKFLGYSEQELYSLRFEDITHPDDLKAEQQQIESVFNGAYQSFEREKRYIKKNGDHVWAYVNISLIADENGTPLAFMAYIRDIHTYKTVTEQLKESEEKLRRITENMHDMICETDESGRLVYLTPSCTKILGYYPHELIHSFVFDKIHPEDVDHAKEAFYHALQGTGTGKVEFRYCHKDGHYIWLEVLGDVLLDDQGKPTGTILSGRDISSRKQTEDALRESEERYRLLVEQSPDGVVVHQNEKFLYANHAAARLTGLDSSDELIGKNIMDFLHESYHEIARERIEKVMVGLRVPVIEIKMRRIDGSPVYVESSTIAFDYKGSRAVQAVIRDITDRKKTEELQRNLMEQQKRMKEAMEYDKVKTEFFANISHELRTPLNVILGTLQLLKLYLREDEHISKRIHKHVQVMKQNCYRLVRLVNNLIDVTKIDAGFYSLRPQYCDIVGLIKDITLSVAGYIESKNIALAFYTEVTKANMVVDPDKIERVMLNLLSNAVKFTDPGGKIKVTIEGYENNIRIRVADTGIGIQEDKMGLLFQRFRQVDKSLTRNHEGSGIGLSLVKSLVNMHGGEIQVYSEYGKGSEFIIDLPFENFKDRLIDQAQDFIGLSDRIERIHVEFSDIYSR